jgi:hypothetical protein
LTVAVLVAAGSLAMSMVRNSPLSYLPVVGETLACRVNGVPPSRLAAA